MAQRVLYQRIVVIGTNGTIAPQGRNNIKDLSSYLGFEVNLNLESLLTLNVENQRAVTHFKKETFSTKTHRFFGSSVEVT